MIQSREQAEWIAIETRCRGEREAFRALDEKQLGDVYLPVVQTKDGGRLLFSRYVFLRPFVSSSSVLREVSTVPAMQSILGSRDSGYRSISDREISVLKTLCSRRVDPRFVPLPAREQKARIHSGVFKGYVGTVLKSGPRLTSLAFTLPIMSGAYEIQVATCDVSPLDEATGAVKSRRRRGGKRMQRFFRRQSFQGIAANHPN